MFIFLLYCLLNMKFTYSTLIIQNTGLYEIKKDDIAVIFFITVENTYDFNIPISVDSVDCIEGDPYLESANYMYLLGGDMGFITKKRTKNLTLIYPNLYLRNRIGKCLVSLHYQNDQAAEEIRKEIFFDTNKVFIGGEVSLLLNKGSQTCTTFDLNSADDCIPVDCVVKYSSRRSYFNKEFKVCQAVPECPPNTVYIPNSNICRKLHEPVCESDLEMIEDGYIERSHSVSNLVNYHCYHGTRNNYTGECVCDDGWSTSTCSEGAYHPTLNLYHMCNIEFNSWEKANREKLLMTVSVLTILAIAIAAKMLLAVCLLNWCCHFIRSRSKNDADEDYCGSYTCPAYTYCGDDACLAGKDSQNERSSRTIRVSFSNMDAISSGGETDVTVSVDENKSDAKSTEKPSQSTLNRCHCK